MKNCWCTLSTQTCSHHQKEENMSQANNRVDIQSIKDEITELIPNGLGQRKTKLGNKFKNALVNETDFLAINRDSLDRFASLAINGEKLNELSIGGFQLDLEKTATKAREVVPLPASKLPKIFLDKELNFYHHFFQGLGFILGHEQVELLATGDIYADDVARDITHMIEEILLTGYNKSDNELTILIKKIVISTFEFEDHARHRSEDGLVNVASNLWGFQYLEQGMQCRESDLKMWITMCHNHYKTLWFNAFKATGVPKFALKGVQTRRPSSSSKSTLDSIQEMSETGRVELDHRERKRRSKAGSIRSSKRTSPEKSIVRWMSST
jgi:hypothetical protein